MSHERVLDANSIEYLRTTWIARLNDCPARWRAEVEAGDNFDNEYARRGTAVHEAIERYFCTPGNPAVDFDWDWMAQHLTEAELPVEERNATVQYLLTVVDPRRLLMGAEPERWVEVEVRQQIPGADLALVGHVDALWWDEPNQRLVILDHKTNRKFESEKLWRRKLQPRAYAWAVRQRFGWQGPIDFEIGYVNLGRVVRWEVTADETATFAEEFRTACADLATYRRHAEWPERLGKACWQCPLQHSCGASRLATFDADQLTNVEKGG